MIFRQLSKSILPALEKDLSKSLNKQLSSMDDLMLMAPRVFCYQNGSSAGSTAGVGAFGRTVSRQQQEGKRGLIKVEKKVERKGLFHE